MSRVLGQGYALDNDEFTLRMIKWKKKILIIYINLQKLKTQMEEKTAGVIKWKHIYEYSLSLYTYIYIMTCWLANE